MCVGPQRAFCGPRSSSETRTRTQRHVRHTLDTRRQKSQVSQSGQLLNLCFERRKKTKCLLQLSKQLKKIFCFQQHWKKTRENNPEWCISARVAVQVGCCLQQLLKKRRSTASRMWAGAFEEKQSNQLLLCSNSLFGTFKYGLMPHACTSVCARLLSSGVMSLLKCVACAL